MRSPPSTMMIEAAALELKVVQFENQTVELASTSVTWQCHSFHNTAVESLQKRFLFCHSANKV